MEQVRYLVDEARGRPYPAVYHLMRMNHLLVLQALRENNSSVICNEIIAYMNCSPYLYSKSLFKFCTQSYKLRICGTNSYKRAAGGYQTWELPKDRKSIKHFYVHPAVDTIETYKDSYDLFTCEKSDSLLFDQRSRKIDLYFNYI